jgi:general secretion pathway protein J
MIRARGFSLLELLIALAVFSVLAGMTYVGLAQLSRTREVLALESERYRQARLLFAELEADLEQLLARPNRDQFGLAQPALQGDATSINFARFSNAQFKAFEADLRRVSWNFSGSRIIRREWSEADPAHNRMRERVIHDAARALQWRYLDAQLVALPRWPTLASSDPMELPRAIELSVELEGLGTIRRLIDLPASEPPP